MKINKFFGGVVAVAASLCMASAVYAEDSKVVLGQPVDLATGAAVADYTVGQHIAVPVEVYSTTSGIKAFGVDFTFDTDSFTYGAVASELSTTENEKLSALGVAVFKNGSDTVDGGIAGITFTSSVTIPGVGTFPVQKELGSHVTSEKSTGVATYQWAHSETVSTAAQTEAYVLFTVKAVPEGLNTNLFTVTASNVGDTADKNTTDDSESEAKANVCEGAFKLTIDKANLGGKYIQKLALTVNGVACDDIKEYVKVSDDKFEFPVRLVDNKNAATSADVVVTVSYSDTDDAAETTWKTTPINLTLDLTAAPTDYSSKAVSVE